MNTIYLDNNATTPYHPDVKQWLKTEAGDLWGNPSAMTQTGRPVKKLLRESRKSFSKLLDVRPTELIFTSGGTESNYISLNQFQNSEDSCPHVISSCVEHPSVLKSLMQWEAEGKIKLHLIDVNKKAQLNVDQYEQILKDNKIYLVSLMYANNEVGMVFPIQKLCALAHEHGALFHSDMTQALGKSKFNLKSLGVDYATFASHKFYALKGAGILYVKQGVAFKNVIIGGGQERSRRAGTENILSIGSMGRVVPYLLGSGSYIKKMRTLRDFFESELTKNVNGVKVNGTLVDRLPNTSHFFVEGVEAENLLMRLDLVGISVNTGAACSAGSPEPSPVLLQMGFSRSEAQSSIRVSLGWENTREDIQKTLDALYEIVPKLRNL